MPARIARSICPRCCSPSRRRTSTVIATPLPGEAAEPEEIDTLADGEIPSDPTIAVLKRLL